MTPTGLLKDLQDHVSRAERRKTDVYRKVFERCVVPKMRIAASKGIPFCMVKIRAFVPGLPAFDRLACMIHASGVLRTEGFGTQIVGPDAMVIDWPRETRSPPPAPPPPRLADGGESADMMLLNHHPEFRKPNGKRVLFLH